jgi:hypothetical protein
MGSSYFSNIEDTVIDNTRMKNIFVRIVLIKERFVDAFNSYKVIDGETPEILAKRFYGDTQLFWLILASNGMKNYFYDWPLTSSELDKYVDKIFDDLSVSGYTETKQQLFDRLTAENEAKKNIEYLAVEYLQTFLYELDNL